MVNQKAIKFPLRRLYFYLTEGCNLRCRHCWINPSFSPKTDAPALDFQLFRAILKQAKPLGLINVKLTGGEPLMHPRIGDILELIRQSQVGLTLETNGIFCTPEIARQIAKTKHPFVSVSLDGINAQTHEWVRGVKGSFQGAIAGIKNLTRAKLKPEIIMTLMKRNKTQVKGMVSLAESLGAGFLKFNMVQPAARGKQMAASGETLSIKELIDIGKEIDDESLVSAKVSLYHSIPLAFNPLSRLFRDNKDRCIRCDIFGILGVLSDGSYALCGIGQTVPELIFGHVSKNKLKDVWYNTPVLKALRQGLPDKLKGICADCLMRHYCKGNCLAQNYSYSKDIWAPYWFCAQAHKEGLFPKSRLKKTPKSAGK